VKKLFGAAVLVSFLGVLAIAQDTQGPRIHVGGAGDPSFEGETGWGNPPASAAKLIFYGGDFNPSDRNEEAFSDGNTLAVPGDTTYGAVTAPKDSKVVATGVLFHVLADPFRVPGPVFDPTTGSYDIRSGVSEGDSGTDLAFGQGPQTATPTGRTLTIDGEVVPEYAVSVNFTTPLIPKGGVTYWVNESPQCTDSNNEVCGVLRYYATNTTEQTNGINPKLQPTGEIFYNSSFFGIPWTNACNLEGVKTPQQCARLSFGIYGTAGN
jgi:hypothetical protein